MTILTMLILSILAAASTPTVKPALPPEPEKPRACQVITETQESDWMEYDDAMELSKGYALIGLTAKVQCRPEHQPPMMNASVNTKRGNRG